MKSSCEFWDKVKSAYKVSIIFPILGFVLAIAGTFYSNFLENQIPPYIRYCLLLLILFLCLLPLIKLIIDEVKRIWNNAHQYDALSAEVSLLKNKNDVLRAENDKLSKINESLRLINAKLVNENYKETSFDVRYAYKYDNVVYIVVCEDGDQILSPESEVFLIDTADGYLLGQFTDPKQKHDGKHCRNLGDVDLLFFSNLLNNQNVTLRPTVRALQIIKKEISENESN